MESFRSNKLDDGFRVSQRKSRRNRTKGNNSQPYSKIRKVMRYAVNYLKENREEFKICIGTQELNTIAYNFDITSCIALRQYGIYHVIYIDTNGDLDAIRIYGEILYKYIERDLKGIKIKKIVRG